MRIRDGQSYVAILNEKIHGKPVDLSNTTGILTHLRREMDELTTALYKHKSKEEVTDECADMLVLLYALCQCLGIDLETAFGLKMERNMRRTWKKPDMEGVIEHESEGV